MPRIRTIKPEFWEDEKVGLLSRDARLLFIGCLNLSDDEGILRWNEMYLMSSLYGYDNLEIELVLKWMKELEKAEVIFPYSGGITKQKLSLIVNFRKHQRIDKPQPTKFPPPSLQNREVRLMYAKRDGFVCQICFGEIEVDAPSGVCGSKRLSIDHIIHKVKGGNDVPSNVRASHLGCNKSRQAIEDAYYQSDSYNDKFIYPPKDHSAIDSNNNYKNSSNSNSKEEGNGKERESNVNGRDALYENESFLVPEMLKIWKIHKPNYPADQTKDFTPLQSIAIFICEQAGMDYRVRSKDDDKNLYELWDIISKFVAEHNFFKNYSLHQVEKHIQSITQEIRNGQTGSKNGKSGTGKVNGQQVNTAFTKFYQNQEST